MPLSLNVLAAFVNPMLFYGGLAAVSGPIIIHLLARRRFKRVRWAATEFLLEAERHNRRRVRIEQLILLVLRCLAVFLIGVLLARPFAAPSGLAAAVGIGGRVERIIVLDDSYSMGYVQSNRTTFAEATAAVRRLLERIRAESQSDAITLLTTSAPEKPVVAGAYLDDAQAESLLMQVEGLSPSERTAQPGATVQEIGQLLEENKGPVQTTVYVLSDFQRVDWQVRESKGASLGRILAPAAEERDVRVVLIDVGRQEARNIAVTDLKKAQNRYVAGIEGARLTAEITNFSDAPTDELPLNVSVGEVGMPPVNVKPIAPHSSVRIPIKPAFPTAGSLPVLVELPDDGLKLDNARFLAVEVDKAIRVLVVNGEPSPDGYRDETTFLTTALRPKGEVFSGNEVRVIDETELGEADLSNFHVVILANLYRVDDLTADRLMEYATAGGGVVFFLGDQVDEAGYNRTLYRDGRGLWPVMLGKRVQAPDQRTGDRLFPIDPTHPVFKVLAGEQNPFITNIEFGQYYELIEQSIGTPLDGEEIASDDNGVARGPLLIPARFGDEEGPAAVVESRLGAGRVVVFASSVDMEWNTWARDPSFVVSMLELVQYAARPDIAPGAVTVGDSMEVPVALQSVSPTATVRTPGFPEVPEMTVHAETPDDEQHWRLPWTDTERSGLYRFELTSHDATTSTKYVAVNPDPGEGDLTKATPSELRAVFDGVEVEYVLDVDRAVKATQDQRGEYWPAILLAVVIVLLAEHSLAWWFGRRV